MFKPYLTVMALLCCALIATAQTPSNCYGFSATYSTSESRCANTGTITITATGGSGDYSYKIIEPIATPLTSTSTITGLAPGTYTVYTKDMVSGCTIIQDNIVVTGSYSDPRFQLVKTDITCNGGSDGTISVTGLQYGRAPFTYTIVSPSTSAVGTSSVTGNFTGLPAGDYYIQLRDSCGGVQTRSINLPDYNWSITNTNVNKINCNKVSVNIELLNTHGAYNTSGTAFDGFSYGYVNFPGDTTWTSSRNFQVTRSPLRTVVYVVKDRCGKVLSFTWTNSVPQIAAGQTISNYTCSTFNVKTTSPLNLTSPQYCLKKGGATVQCNTTGDFTNVPYGNYCIEVRDACYDTLITRCFNVPAPTPAIGASVTINNYQCSTFNATVTGQTNLYSPQYCLFNAANVQVSCNTTGVFANIPYGTYTIRTTSSAPCYDTTIVRTITVAAPKPTVTSAPAISALTCSSFTASVTGQSNVFNATYCLYDNLGNLIGCNTNGVWTGLAFGSYCYKITSSTPCYDTTITNCFTVNQPQPAAGNPVISARTCTTFTVTIPSVTNIPDAKYCLKDNNNVTIACNTTGVFTNVPYGAYCIEIVTTNGSTPCPAVPVTKCFTAARLAPSIGASVTISGKTCTGFNAAITGQTNLISPNYCLYNSSNVLVSCNTTGSFTNIPYGTYSIRVSPGCGDADIVRNFTVNADPVAFSLLATESCTINTTNIKVTVASGLAPYTAKVIGPLNNVIATQAFSTSTYTFNNIPALTGSLNYRVAVINSCNQTDTVTVSPNPSIFNRITSATSKCPSAQFQNGSGALTMDLVSNIGMITPAIIKKNGVNVTMNPATNVVISANQKRFGFGELAPATYIVEWNISTCSQRVYDTITITDYQYPDLQNSAGYQCDNNNFSISAAGNGGVAPFTYEIIGSNPVGPSIVTPAQASPIFAINTNQPYSLVRMRAVDACGNGTLSDVSVLPLGNLNVSSNNIDCYSNNITLSVDTIPNATYTWYRKTSPTDSVLITTSQNYNIPYLLPTDTGTYVCKTSVNNGCLLRLSYYNLDGDCSPVLPVKLLSFTGKMENDKVVLNWKVNGEKDIRSYTVERRIAQSVSFAPVGTKDAINNGNATTYTLPDENPAGGVSQYRLKITSNDGKVDYSNIITISNEQVSVHTMPNPVVAALTVQLSGKTDAVYEIALVNMAGQVFYKQQTQRIRSGAVVIERNKIPAGIYLVKILNKNNGETFTKKVMYH